MFPRATSTRLSRHCTRRSSLAEQLHQNARIGVVGATGAVGAITLELLRERGYSDVRLFASERSAGKELDGTSASRELVPHAVRGGAV